MNFDDLPIQAPTSDKKIRENLEFAAKYKESSDQLIIKRQRILAISATPIMALFTFLDRIIYPAKADLFFILRLIECTIFAIIYGVSYLPKASKYATLLSNTFVMSAVLTVLAFIYLTDGAQSQYYQGINIIITALLFANSFNYVNNLLMCVAFFSLYTIVAIKSPAGWSTMGYFYGSFFMAGNSILVVILTSLYESQYRQTFLTNIQLKKLYDKADELSKIDDLTKIYNRRHFMQLLEEKMEHCRVAKSTFFLVFFDIDYFKKVNDAYGHLFGDMVLKAVVDRIRSKIRITNLMGRYGGDEFIFFLDLTNSERFLERVKPIQMAVQDLSLLHQGKKVPISVSFGGVKVSPGRFRNITEVTDAADQALLEVKKTQRGEIRLVE